MSKCRSTMLYTSCMHIFVLLLLLLLLRRRRRRRLPGASVAWICRDTRTVATERTKREEETRERKKGFFANRQMQKRRKRSNSLPFSPFAKKPRTTPPTLPQARKIESRIKAKLTVSLLFGGEKGIPTAAAGGKKPLSTTSSSPLQPPQ